MDAAKITIKALVEEMADQGRTRLPVLNDEKPKYIVHGSMIDRFVRERAFDGKEVQDLSLMDLLNYEPMKNIFLTSFVCVDKTVTIMDAATKMKSSEGCQDIFVTDTGDSEGRVLGWLADRDLIEGDEQR